MFFKYTKSQLTNDQFLGCNLDEKFYRLNNLQKLNSLLSYGYSHGYTVQIFEILDDPIDLNEELHQLRKDKALYAKMSLNGVILVAILSPKGLDYAIGVVDSVSQDYTLLANFKLGDDEIDLESCCFHVYQLAQHIDTKQSRKQKLFSSSDVDDEMKSSELIFVKSPKLVARSS